jgi:hypothetical protein
MVCGIYASPVAALFRRILIAVHTRPLRPPSGAGLILPLPLQAYTIFGLRCSAELSNSSGLTLIDPASAKLREL